MADRSVVVRLRAEIGQYTAAMAKASQATKDFGRDISGHGKAAQEDIDKVGRAAGIAAIGIAAGLGLAAKAAMDWESAWAGVTKTVDGTEAQMAELEGGLRDLASELPATHAEIAGVAEAAGALGIQRSAIEGFTRTMIDLGETTNVTADQAATSFAQIGNIMGTAQGDFDRMGSTLVELGNNGASTEAEILELANRLAAAGKIAGLSEADIFAFGSTLASVGVEAEAGGTALSKVFTTVSDAVLDGSDKLDTFARVAGTTAEDFAASFREDPATAINEFVMGLGRMIDSGESTTGVFQELELTDSRLMNALRSTAGAGELLAQSIDQGRAAWEANNALQTEAEKRYDTTAAKMEIARNNIVDLGIDIGGTLLPALASGAEAAGNMARGFADLPDPLKIAGVGIAGVSAGVAGLAAVIPHIQRMRAALQGMGAAGAAANAALPWLAAAAVAIGAVSFALGENARKSEEAEDQVKSFADAIREAGSVGEGTANQLSTLVSESSGLSELLDATGTTVEELAAAVAGSDADFETFKQDLLDGAEAAGVSRDAMALAMFGMDGIRTAAQGGATEAERLGRLLGGTGDEAERAAPKIGSVASELGLNADEAERARDEFQDLMDAYRASIDPLFGMLDALEANREALAAEAEARAEGAKAVAEATEAVADAEADLRDARDTPDNAEGIAAAEERLADARERLGEVQGDAAVTAEELAAMNQAAAESALDLEVAAMTLAGAIADGTVDVEAAKGMLLEWTDQGLITAEQAYAMGIQFDAAAGKADVLAGDRAVNFYTNAAETAGAIDLITAAVRNLSRQIELNPYSADVAQSEKFVVRAIAASRAATGGVRQGLTWVGEEGPELVNLGSPSRVFPHAESMQMAGSMFAGSTGAGLSAPTGAGAAGASYDHRDYSKTWRPQFTVVSPSPQQAAGSVQFKLRRLALEAGV